jgi:hypothetical protein
MLGKNQIRKSITLLTAIAVWTVYSMVAFAATPDMTGEISVIGQVTVNGQTAVSNSTLMTGSTIATGTGSSAVVSLGKSGRIELGADSNITLKFTDTSIVGMLSSGKARVSNSAGVATTFTTKDATVIADAGQADSFALEVECSHTHVDTTSGLVNMRTGNNDKQVAAGTTAVAGNLSQTGCAPCLRPGSAPPVAALGIGTGALAAILLGVAGAAAAAIILGRRDNVNGTDGNTVVVVSPNR